MSLPSTVNFMTVSASMPPDCSFSYEDWPEHTHFLSTGLKITSNMLANCSRVNQKFTMLSYHAPPLIDHLSQKTTCLERHHFYETTGYIEKGSTSQTGSSGSFVCWLINSIFHEWQSRNMCVYCHIDSSKCTVRELHIPRWGYAERRCQRQHLWERDRPDLWTEAHFCLHHPQQTHL